MGGYLPTPGFRLFGETVMERDNPGDYDRLRKLHMAVRELEIHVTKEEVALTKETDERVAHMRRRTISDSQARIKEYRDEIRRLDEGEDD